jgi:hypothetical protein
MSNNENAKVMKMNAKNQHPLMNASPAELEKFQYDELRDLQQEIRNHLNGARGAKQRHLEEQYCFVTRELEFRNMPRVMIEQNQASRATRPRA